MNDIVEVEFRSGRLGYYAQPENVELKPESHVIVEVERGEDIAKVIHSSVLESDEEVVKKGNNILKILRNCTEEDFGKLKNIEESEQKASEKFSELESKYDFEMKLIDTIYQFDGNKLTFFFTADGRVDFRQFVRELASVFRTRIELHQTSGRDHAKRLGGYGMCGYKYCCSSYIKRFNQVTIKMAKDQNLSNNLSKVSGPCGRLLCCLNYEENFYVESAKDFPQIGDEINYNGSEMYVYKIDCYNKRVHLASEDQQMEIIELEAYNKLIKNKKSNGRNRYNKPEKNRNSES